MMDRRDFLKLSVAVSMAPLVASETPKIKILHVTDSHMDFSMPYTVEAMEHLAKVVNEQFNDIDCVLFGGDNFNNTAPSNKDAKKFKEIIDMIKKPVFCVRGNKESSPKGDNRIDAKEFARLFFDAPMKVNGRDWMVQLNGYVILGLDSTIEHSGAGRYTKDTITFAKNALDLGKPTIILNHHPYLNYWKGTDPKDIHKYVLQNSTEVQEKLFRYPNLILTLSGHKHIDNVSKIGHVTTIASRAFKAAKIKNKNPIRLIEIEGMSIKERLLTT